MAGGEAPGHRLAVGQNSVAGAGDFGLRDWLGATPAGFGSSGMSQPYRSSAHWAYQRRWHP
jgi:hypothetical protein